MSTTARRVSAFDLVSRRCSRPSVVECIEVVSGRSHRVIGLVAQVSSLISVWCVPRLRTLRKVGLAGFGDIPDSVGLRIGIGIELVGHSVGNDGHITLKGAAVNVGRNGVPVRMTGVSAQGT